MSQNLNTPPTDTKNQCSIQCSNMGFNFDGPGSSSLENTPRTLSTSPEMMEKLYLPPKVETRVELRQTFGNPTPVALLGFCVALTPLSIELMGWRGAVGFPATNGANYFFGGLLLTLSGIGEFLLGNTFPSVVFFAYGSHFLTVAATFTPSFAAISYYTSDGSQKQTPEFLISFGFYFLFMGLLSVIFLICSFRTNAIFVVIFSAAVLGFALGTGGLWAVAAGNVTPGARLLQGTGGCFFVASMAGWYLLLAIMMTVVDMPFVVPIFDISHVFKGMSDRQRQHED